MIPGRLCDRFEEEDLCVTITVKGSHAAELTMSTSDRPGLIKDVSGALAGLQLSIEEANISTDETGRTENAFTVKAVTGQLVEQEECFLDKDGFVCESMLDKLKDALSEAITVGFSG